MIAYALGITELDPDEARPAVRALPQPRAHLHARHRHGLRRAPPRRHDPLRHREVRRGAGGADHHLRLHQGEGGDQGQRARPGPPLRARRPHHEGDAPGRHGQGHLARRVPSTRRTPGTARPRSSARCTRPRPTSEQVVDTAKGLEGLKRQPGVHAAGVILCREPLLDVIPVWRREQDGAVITQFDMGACESLGLLKMDFLGLRNLTVLDDCLRHIESNRGETIVLEDARPRRPGHLRAPHPRRHPRGVPARRRPDAGAAALDAARQLRGHLRGPRPVPARSDGRQRPQRLRRPQERPQAGRADPSRARRAAGRHPGRHVRPDRVPGAGHGHRAEARRATPSAPPTCCAGRWARRRRRSSTRSTSPSARA